MNYTMMHGSTNIMSRNVSNYPSTLRNIPEERRSHLHHSGNLRSHKLKDQYGNEQRYMTLSSLPTKCSILVMEKLLLKRERENEDNKQKNRKKKVGGTNIRPVNPLKPELNPICYLLALFGAHHFLHVSRIRVKLLTFRRLMSYIYIWRTHS